MTRKYYSIILLKGINTNNDSKMVFKSKNFIDQSYNILSMPNDVKVFKDNSNTNVKVLLTKCKFEERGVEYPSCTSCHCWWCRSPFESEPMGIPINSKEEGVDVAYNMEGFFCSPQCCCAFLCDHEKKFPYKRDNRYKNSLTILRNMYERIFPGEELVPALDWRLLQIVGNGNMTIENFRSNNRKIDRTPNVHFIPCGVFYRVY
jgi:hypothetical protein